MEKFWGACVFCEIWLWPKSKGAYEEEAISFFFFVI
jgi:hypothetical protein